MNKWHFHKKYLFKLAHSIKVLISKTNITENYAIETPASLVYRVSFGNMQIQFHQRKYPWGDKIFFRIVSVWGKEQISSR